MTVDEAFDVLAAIDVIARAHGLECRPTIRERALVLEFFRGRHPAAVLTLSEAMLNQHEGAAHKEFIEREVAWALHARNREAAT